MKHRHKRPVKRSVWSDCNHDPADAIDITDQLRKLSPKFMAVLDQLFQELDPEWQAHRAKMRKLHTDYPRKWKKL